MSKEQLQTAVNAMPDGANAYTYTLPFSCDTYLFMKKKAVAVYFGDKCVPVVSWKQVYRVILERCNEHCHERLMYLRDKVAGKVRVFLSCSPNGMTRPLRIADDIWCETQYGSQTLMHILRERILKPAQFDYSDIRISVK